MAGNPLPLLAFGFGNLAMLGWLAAVGVPLVIHLWNRRRYREVPWAAMEYLLAAMRKNARRLQLEEWLLLVLRMALIAAAVLAVAEPFLERAGLAWLSGEHTHRVLVLDGSYSMDYRAGEQSRWERARQVAGEIVERSPQGDAFSVVLMAAPPSVVIGSPAFSREEVLRELDALERTDAGFSLGSSLARVAEVVEQARRDQPRLKRHEVYFLTDLAREGWLPASAAARTEVRERSQALAQVAALTVVDLGQPPGDHWGVTELTSDSAWTIVGGELSAQARVRHFGGTPPGPLALEILADGQRVGEVPVELSAGGEVAVPLRHRFDRPGDHTFEVRLPDDPLAVDNQRWLACRVREQLRVLCINGRPSGEAFAGATDYLAVALAPHEAATGAGPVQVEVAGENALSEVELSPYDAVFLADVGQFTAAEAQALAGYLEQGGGLVIFTGDQVQPESYERHLGGGAAPATRLLPAQLSAAVAPGAYHFDPGDYRHPLVRDFENQERAGLLGALVYRYQRLTVPPDSAARVALKFQETGDPAIVEHRWARGRVILVATSADASWNAWVLGPGYLPVVQEMLALAVRSRGEERNLRVGQPLGGTLPVLASTVAIEVVRPGGESAAVESQLDGQVNRWSYADTDRRGVYTARVGPPVSGLEPFAVNVDPAESDLAPLDPAELGEQVWPGVPYLHRTQWDADQQTTPDELRTRGGLHRSLLGLVLALIVGDTLLSWYFGRARG